MKKILGIDIREVWDFRLSIGSPILYQDGDTWIVRVWANDPGDETKVLLAEHDTGVETNGDPYQSEGVIACFKWLYSVRDEFSRDNIEHRKPVVAMINAANDQASKINAERAEAQQAGDHRLVNEKTGELQNHLTVANSEIKKACAKMDAAITQGGDV